MKEETKAKLRSVCKYVRELSIVVAGIAITFTISDIINNNQEKKDIKRYLYAVQVELEENLKEVKEHNEFFERTAALSNYLLSAKREELETDSLMQYTDVYGDCPEIIFKTSSFEMFKISGTMRLMKNKILLDNILESYTMLEVAQNSGKTYINRKTDELFRTFLETDDLTMDHIYFIKYAKDKRLHHFFSIDTNIQGLFRMSKRQIERTLGMME